MSLFGVQRVYAVFVVGVSMPLAFWAAGNVLGQWFKIAVLSWLPLPALCAMSIWSKAIFGELGTHALPGVIGELIMVGYGVRASIYCVNVLQKSPLHIHNMASISLYYTWLAQIAVAVCAVTIAYIAGQLLM